MELVNPAIILRQASLRPEFDAAKPFRHIIIDEFLEAEFCSRLARDFPAFDAVRARNEMGQTGRKAVRPDVAAIGPEYRTLDELLRNPVFLDFIGGITGIPSLLYDPDYVGGGTHENLDGQELDVHVDFNYHPRTRWHRRLNLILFLNRDWDADWGGVLELQQDPSLPPSQNTVRSIVPAFNRCVIFETTESSWHGFRRITLPEDKQGLSRRSVAVYFYTKERPGDETGPSHGTLYIPRPCPEFIRADHTLTAKEAWEIEGLFARRDEQIRYLYGRELEFSRIAQSPAFRLARALTWPLRKMRDLRRRRD